MMDLITLNSSTLKDEDVVENYQSLIWTERYSKAGDFELKSNNIASTIKALPLESYVSLRDTTVPMLVELYQIEKKPEEAPIITVKGRSFEACALERRASVNAPLGGVRAPWLISATKESDAAYKAMRAVLGDIARIQSGITVLDLISPAVSPLDAISELDLTLPVDYVNASASAWSSIPVYAIGDIVTYSSKVWKATTANSNTAPVVSTGSPWTFLGNVGSYEIKPNTLYNTILELITTNNRGIKAVRPFGSETQIHVEIYNGANLTETVVFDARFDQFDSATYLLSKQGSTNVAYVYGVNGSQQVLKTAAAEPSGLARRVLLLDETSDSTVNTVAIRQSRGLIELYKYNETALFDGQIALQVARGYNKDYFLGDILKLTGEYGLSQNVRVAEFIRSYDATGEKAYPTFEAVTS